MNYFSVKKSVDYVEVVYASCTKYGNFLFVVGGGGQCGGSAAGRSPAESACGTLEIAPRGAICGAASHLLL